MLDLPSEYDRRLLARERRTPVLVAALAVLFALACGSRPRGGEAWTNEGASKPPPPRWLTQLDQTNPLVGRIWDVRAAKFAEHGDVTRRLVRARFVLLGEKHDNPDHHVLQAGLVWAFTQMDRKPAIAFEMLDVGKQPLVDAYRRGAAPDAAGFGHAVGWEATSWPKYEEYRSIVAAAFANGLPILAANLEHDTARALVKEGTKALPAERLASLGLDRPFPPELEAPLLAELHASHCGHLPESMLAPMALAQHGRDAQMARVLLDAPKAPGVVLIAGSGHARHDRGVPYYLRLAEPGATIASVRFQEVAHGVTEAEKYLASGDVHGPAFDFVWFTPRASDDDPCAAFTR